MTNQIIDFGTVKQGAKPTRTFTWPLAAGETPDDLTGFTITGTAHHKLTGDVTALSGTLAVEDGATRECSWAMSSADTGTAGDYQITLTATDGTDTIKTLYGELTIEQDEAVNAAQNEGYTGVTTDERSWLTIADATIADPSDLETATGSKAYTDAAKAAAEADAFLAPTTSRLNANVTAGASDAVLRDALSASLWSGVAHAVVDCFTEEAELCTINGSGRAEPLAGTFAYNHSAGDPVMILYRLELHPELWGANADGTDCVDAINACAAVCRANQLGMVFGSGSYYVSDTVWLGRGDSDVITERVPSVKGQGRSVTEIVSAFDADSADQPIIDWTGGHLCSMSDITIRSNNTTNKPSCGVLLARNSSGDSAGWHFWQNVTISGNFVDVPLYEYGSEENRFIQCEFRAGSADSAAYINTGDNVTYALTSPNATIATGAQSNISHIFYGCRFNHDDASAAVALVHLEDSVNVVIDGSYFNFSGVPTGGKAILSSGCNGLRVERNKFHGSEMAYCLYMETGTHRGITWRTNEDANAATRTIYSAAGATIDGSCEFRVDYVPGTTVSPGVEFDGSVDDYCAIDCDVIDIAGNYQGDIYTISTGTLNRTGNCLARVYYYDTQDLHIGPGAPGSAGDVVVYRNGDVTYVMKNLAGAEGFYEARSVYVGIGSKSNHQFRIYVNNGEHTRFDTSGNIEILGTGDGIFMKSPDGTRYKLTIANGGTVNVAAA